MKAIDALRAWAATDEATAAQVERALTEAREAGRDAGLYEEKLNRWRLEERLKYEARCEAFGEAARVVAESAEQRRKLILQQECLYEWQNAESFRREAINLERLEERLHVLAGQPPPDTDPIKQACEQGRESFLREALTQDDIRSWLREQAKGLEGTGD